MKVIGTGFYRRCMFDLPKLESRSTEGCLKLAPSGTLRLAGPLPGFAFSMVISEGLVWRFRSPHHSCGESEMQTSEPKPH